ncbi:hypothetical protein [Pseudomonas sp. 65/3-MNA-CIBAN-0223]|uniref:hypothetical protein n=1 Tax=Pseudomonas sp. 65/3-MNA-CIBAN-0223 TaxID=3140476 RepID=UPI00332ED278
MTTGMRATYNTINNTFRHRADTTKLSISPPPKNNARGLLVSVNNISSTLAPVIEQPSSQKSTSLYKKVTHFFQCKKLTAPPAFVFFGQTFNFDVDTIRQSDPRDESHMQTREQINKLDQAILDLRRHCEAEVLKIAKGNECVYIIRDLNEKFFQLERIESQLQRLKVGFGKYRAHDTGLNCSINNCANSRRELNMMIESYHAKQKPISSEQIKQICSQSRLLCKKAEKLYKKSNDNKLRKKAYDEPQKKSLIEKINHARTALERAGNTIENNRPWYSRNERMEVNIAFTAIKEAARRLNFGEYERSLNDVASLTIPRAKLKSPNNPTQSNW